MGPCDETTPTNKSFKYFNKTYVKAMQIELADNPIPNNSLKF